MLIQHIRELTEQVAGDYLTNMDTDVAAAEANLDMLMVRHLQRRILADSGPQSPTSNSDISQVLEHTRDLLQQFGIDLDAEREARLHFYAAKQYRRAGAWSQAVGEYQQSASVAHNSGQALMEAHSLKEIGHIHSEQSAWRQAADAYERASGLYGQLGHSSAVGEITKNLAINAFQTGEYQAALEKAHQVLQIAEDIGDVRLDADIHNLLGTIHDARGDLDRAVTYYQRSLLHYEQIDDPAGLAQSYHNLGMTYTKRQEWQEAGEAYEHCLRIAQEYGNQQILASVFFNRALLYFRLHDTLMAKTYCQESIQMFEQLEFPRGLANAYKLLGMIQTRTQSWSEAERFFRVATRLCEVTQDTHTRAEVCVEWGIMEQRREQNVMAQTLMNRAYELFTQLGASEPAARAQSLLGTLTDN